MLNELVKLAKYKSWANEITYLALSEISDAELFKPRLTNFKNISSTMNHVYVVDDIFKSHLLGVTHEYSHRNTETCPPFSVLRAQQSKLDKWYVNFVSGLKVEELGKTVNFDFVGGGKGRMSITEIVFHIVNHGTYHRGFVSDMMYQIPAVPPANDLTIYLRDVHEEK